MSIDFETSSTLAAIARHSQGFLAGALALEDADVGVTYGELDSQSRRVAERLDALGAPRGAAVAVLVPKSPASVLLAIGAMGSGRVFVPLDSTAPPALLAAQLSLMGAAVVTTGPGQEDLIAELGLSTGATCAVDGLPGVVLTRRDGAIREYAAELAYMIFTSGSSGEPKGVMITHENLDRFVEDVISRFKISPGVRAFNPAPLHFDFAIFDVFGMLAGGATLLCMPELRFPADVVAHLQGRRVTFLAGVPSYFMYLTGGEAPSPDWFPHLDAFLYAGELFPVDRLRQWMAAYPRARFINAYGPTEATVFVASHEVEAWRRERIPIGTPFKGVHLHLLDSEGRPVADGETGELWIEGVLVGRGYLAERADAARFLDSLGGRAGRYFRSGDLAVRRDGDVFIIGRADSQTKIAGRRVELGAVEQAMTSLPGVTESAVLPMLGRDGNAVALECHVATLRDAASLRTELASVLPAYMLPARIVVHAALPRNASGKIDRRALSAATTQAMTPAPPA